MTHEQQIGRALATYQTDSAGYYPRVSRDPINTPYTGDNEFSWDDELAIGRYDGRSSGSFGTAGPGAIATEDQAFDLYTCPLDLERRGTYPTEDNPMNAGLEAPRSYALSFLDRSTILATPLSARGVSGFNETNQPISLRLEDIKEPSNTIALSESSLWNGANCLNRLGEVYGGYISSGPVNPTLVGANPVRVVGHHVRKDPFTLLGTKVFTTHYLYADSHVEATTNEDTFLGETVSGDARGTQWDALK